MHEQSEFEDIFKGSESKLNILSKSKIEIENKLRMISHSPPIERVRRAAGSLFETLVIQELTKNETENQKNTRLMIEEAFNHSKLLFGEEDTSSHPDTVSVIFDEYGKPTIEKTIEIKLSKEAQEKGIEHDQPQKTLDTMIRTVDILNQLISGEVMGNLPGKASEKRVQLFNTLRKKIKTSNLTTISFSQNLSYTEVIPSNIEQTTMIFRSPLKLKTGEIIRSQTIRSQFSSKEIGNMLDIYSEKQAL